MEQFKTAFLLVSLTLIIIAIGGLIGGSMGVVVAFVVSLGMNFFSYFYSDKLVLRHYRAVEVNEQNAKGYYDIVKKLTQKANMPMPKIYIIPEAIPNAFATGRNPQNAAVAVTEGILELLNEDEIEGVIAHELSHIKHFDILISTIAAVIAGAIAMLANFLQFGSMFSNSNEKEGANPILMIILAIVMPIAATIIQMSISRSREYLADEGAAYMTGHPEWLQSALIKLDNYARGGVMHDANPQDAHMFIVNPFTGKSFNFSNLFSTHPTTQSRVERLEELKRNFRR